MLDVIKKLQERFAKHAEAEQFDVSAMRVEAARTYALESVRALATARGSAARIRALDRLESAAYDLVRAETSGNA